MNSEEGGQVDAAQEEKDAHSAAEAYSRSWRYTAGTYVTRFAVSWGTAALITKTLTATAAVGTIGAVAGPLLAAAVIAGTAGGAAAGVSTLASLAMRGEYEKKITEDVFTYKALGLKDWYGKLSGENSQDNILEELATLVNAKNDNGKNNDDVDKELNAIIKSGNWTQQDKNSIITIIEELKQQEPSARDVERVKLLSELYANLKLNLYDRDACSNAREFLVAAATGLTAGAVGGGVAADMAQYFTADITHVGSITARAATVAAISKVQGQSYLTNFLIAEASAAVPVALDTAYEHVGEEDFGTNFDKFTSKFHTDGVKYLKCFESEDKPECNTVLKDLQEATTFQKVDIIFKEIRDNNRHFASNFMKYLNENPQNFLDKHFPENYVIKGEELPNAYIHSEDARTESDYAKDLREVLQNFLSDRPESSLDNGLPLIIDVPPSTSPNLGPTVKKGLIMKNNEDTVRYYSIGDGFSALSGAVDSSNVVKGIEDDFKKVEEKSGVILSSKVSEAEGEDGKKTISIIINNSDAQSKIIFHDERIKKLSDNEKFYFKLNNYTKNKTTLTIINKNGEEIGVDNIKEGDAKTIFDSIKFEIYCKNGKVESKFDLSKESKIVNFSEIEGKKQEITGFAENSTKIDIINQQSIERTTSDAISR